MAELRAMSIDEAIEAHGVLDAIEEAQVAARAPQKFDW
jgi:hypothetical protein